MTKQQAKKSRDIAIKCATYARKNGYFEKEKAYIKLATVLNNIANPFQNEKYI